VERYEATDGVEGGELGGRPVVIVTHRGRKTGAIRKTPLMRVVDGERYLLVGSLGGAPADPEWVGNLRALPEVELRDRAAVQRMRVREVSGEERARLWAVAVAAFPPYAEYQTKTARVIPVFVAEPRAAP
jgi:deazaflavin-dependent oxidoreductase (nitroreductase family)